MIVAIEVFIVAAAVAWQCYVWCRVDENAHATDDTPLDEVSMVECANDKEEPQA